MNRRERAAMEDIWLSEFASRKTPALSCNGMVSCTQPLASQAGQEILKAGGNAADAAVAMAAALAVSKPNGCGLGGDAFCLYYDANEKRVRALNGSGRSPAAMTLERLHQEGWSIDNPWPITHGHAVTVPGAVAAFLDTLEWFGSKKVSVDQIFEPSIRLAEEGVPLTESVAALWRIDLFKLTRPANTHGCDLLVNGAPPRWGHVWRNTRLASVLKAIVKDGKKGFYEGRVAEAIVNTAQKHGGLLTLEDLASHVSTLEEPISVDYRGVRVWETPPNGQGLTALIALNVLHQWDMAGMGHNTADYLHHLAEALRQGFGSALNYVADPAKAKIPVGDLLSEEYAAKLRARVDTNRTKGGIPTGGAVHVDSGSDTVYITTADCHGNACSFIFSNFTKFGSGLVPEGCGFPLQNRGCGFSLQEGHLNVAGPSKRPYHTIIPCMLTRPDTGELLASYGVMGGFMQPQGHVQVLLNMLEFGMDPQVALDKPRLLISPKTGELSLEDGIPEDVANQLRERGHVVHAPVRAKDREMFGRGQVITRGAWWSKNPDVKDDSNVWWASSGPRGDGHPMGY